METNQIIPINRKQNAAAKAVLKALKALVTFMGCPISHLNHKHTSKHMHTHTLSLSLSLSLIRIQTEHFCILDAIQMSAFYF